VPLVATEVEDNPHVGSVALDIKVVTAQPSVTVPENELPAVTVMSEVLPLDAPGLTRMLPPLLSVKLLLPLPGACQKFPHPVREKAKNGAAASNSLDQLPILIAAPLSALIAPCLLRHPNLRVSPGCASCLAMQTRTQTLCRKRRSPARIRLSLSPCLRLIDS
jgi:hypothetical protein